MSHNCLVTKLKVTVNNDNCPILGALVFKTKVVASATSTTQRLQMSSSDDVNVTGFIRSRYEDLPVNTQTTIALNGANKSVFLDNRASYVQIDNKYAITSLKLNKSIDGEGKQIDLSELSSIENLTEIMTDETSPFEGDLSSIDNHMDGLSVIRLENNHIRGNITSLASKTQLTELNLYGNDVSGTIEAFVGGQYDKGRTVVSTDSPIRTYHILKYCTFGGNNYKDIYVFLTWSNRSKIAMYAGENVLANCTKVYCKGYTQEEAESAFSGKTIIRVDA